MRQKVVVALTAWLVLGFFAAVASAEDIYPPEWRGDPRTTFQRWEFSTPDPNPLPQVSSNPYGMPQTEVIPSADPGWFNVMQGRQGVWELSGVIMSVIPNVPDPGVGKDVWVQLTWSQFGDQPARVQVVDPSPIEQWPRFDGVLQQEVNLGNGWLHSTWSVHLPFNPPEEMVYVHGDVYVDEMVVDTRCVPEPSTLALAGLGGLMALAVVARRRLAKKA
jgi:hypothetical protein